MGLEKVASRWEGGDRIPTKVILKSQASLFKAHVHIFKGSFRLQLVSTINFKTGGFKHNATLN
jgi:hypothetical protein